MPELKYFIAGLLVLILLLIIYIPRLIEDTLLKGFWSANAAFCQEADLKWFVLYIGNSADIFGTSRYAYFCVANENGIILNHYVKINLGYAFVFNPYIAKEKTYNIEIEWKEESNEELQEIEDVFPSKLKMTYYPVLGKIVLYENDTVKSILWKDLQTSAYSYKYDSTPDDLKNNSESMHSESGSDKVEKSYEEAGEII